MNIKVTLQEIMDEYNWEKACEVLGIDPWCINEGTATSDEILLITEEQAKEIGIEIAVTL